jgi:hypothetical protein
MVTLACLLVWAAGVYAGFSAADARAGQNAAGKPDRAKAWSAQSPVDTQTDHYGFLAMAKDKTIADDYGYKFDDASTDDAQPLWNGSTPIRGFALNYHHTRDVGIYYKAIDHIADMGFNAVEIVTPMYQTNGATTDIGIRIGPGQSPDPKDLASVLRHAKSRGLTTTLMPIVLLAQPRGNEWRGKIRPDDWKAWWAAYEAAMDGYIRIAVQTRVDVLSVGSELLTTERQREPWARFISQVRARFKGKLSYSTNWDHYHVPVFWSELDMIGINGYWNLVKDVPADRQPTDDDLIKRWTQIQTQLLDFGKSKNKPILLTEIGYPSLPWGLKDPWNYVNSKKVSVDQQQQARGYKAFLAVWNDLLLTSPDTARIAGVYFYKWDPYFKGDYNDSGYGVLGKPAYELLKTWLQSRPDKAAGQETASENKPNQ